MSMKANVNILIGNMVFYMVFLNGFLPRYSNGQFLKLSRKVAQN